MESNPTATPKAQASLILKGLKGLISESQRPFPEVNPYIQFVQILIEQAEQAEKKEAA